MYNRLNNYNSKCVDDVRLFNDASLSLKKHQKSMIYAMIEFEKNKYVIKHGKRINSDFGVIDGIKGYGKKICMLGLICKTIKTKPLNIITGTLHNLTKWKSVLQTTVLSYYMITNHSVIDSHVLDYDVVLVCDSELNRLNDINNKWDRIVVVNTSRTYPNHNIYTRSFTWYFTQDYLNSRFKHLTVKCKTSFICKSVQSDYIRFYNIECCSDIFFNELQQRCKELLNNAVVNIKMIYNSLKFSIEKINDIDVLEKIRDPCIVCMDDKKIPIILKCCRNSICLECFTNLKKEICPMCRSSILDNNDIILPCQDNAVVNELYYSSKCSIYDVLLKILKCKNKNKYVLILVENIFHGKFIEDEVEYHGVECKTVVLESYIPLYNYDFTDIIVTHNVDVKLLNGYQLTAKTPVNIYLLTTHNNNTYHKFYNIMDINVSRGNYHLKKLIL